MDEVIMGLVKDNQDQVDLFWQDDQGKSKVTSSK